MTGKMENEIRIFLVATEPSGDVLGAGLMRALKNKLGNRVVFSGVGGGQMQAEGLQFIFPQTEVAVFGLIEILPKLFNLLKRLDQTVAAAKAFHPHAVVTIDGPDFSKRVAKKLKNLGFPLIHYVAPTVWAWRKGRAAVFAKIFDHLLALFSFEPDYFTSAGLPCTFVGHRAVEHMPKVGDAAAFRTTFNIPPDKKILCVLPGSRKSEIKRLTPIFGQTLARIYDKLGQPVVVVPTVTQVRDELEKELANWPVKPIVFDDTQLRDQAFAASHAALATSGTVTLELAVTGTPHLVTQRLNTLTVLIFIQLVGVKFFNLVNIFFDWLIVPEPMQYDCNPDNLAKILQRVWEDDALRADQKEAFAKLIPMLKPEGQMPNEKAADTVLKIIGITP